ncbi:MAG: DUF3887 domain-containing protein [Xanthomonadaceae bacterium]|jgi:dienelactone hydrolase|nr:DUF3887 domain-containing protein [Xanthomonadaceae bacterium]
MTGNPEEKTRPLQINARLAVGGAFLLLLVIALIAMSLFQQKPSGDNERPLDPDRAAAAEHFIRFIERTDYASAYAMLGSRFQQRFSQESFQGTWEGFLARTGPLQMRNKARAGLDDSLEAVVYTMQFRDMALDLRLLIDTTGRVSDFAFDTAHPQALAQMRSQASHYVERETWVGEMRLPGLLTSPARMQQTSAVILMHEAGFQDRDQTIGNGKPFRDLAYGLAARGIAVLRYQKRPLSAEAATLNDEYVDDAVAAINLLRQIPGIDPARIYIAGYGLGGSVAPLVAERDGNIAGLILLAADARPAQTTLASRLSSPRLPAGYWENLARYDPVATARLVGRPLLLIQGDRDSQVTVNNDLARWEAGLANCGCITSKRYATIDHSLLPVGIQDGSAASPPVFHQLPAQVIDDIAAWIEPSPAAQ